MDSIHFMNIEIDNVTTDEAVNSIEKCINNKEKMFVVTPNVDHMIKLQSNEAFLNAYRNAGLVAVDGTPIMVVAKWYGTPLKEKITGPKLTEETVRMAAKNGFSIFILGAGPGIGDKAAKQLLKKYPGFDYVGSYSPPFGFEESIDERRKIINIVNKAKPQIVITGMGSPKTEIFLNEIYQELDANVSLSVGAAIDFCAGTTKRCPNFINAIGMEWFYRFLQEPKRMFKRYFINDIGIIGLVLKYKGKLFRGGIK